MNLTEATDKEVKEILSYNGRNWQGYRDMLEERGFEEIGFGSSSITYSKSNYKKAIKLSYFKDDKHWTWYAKYCKKNKNRNPYLLRVYDMNSFITVSERLKDMKKFLNTDEEREIWKYFSWIEILIHRNENIEEKRMLDLEEKYRGHKLFDLLFYINDKYLKWKMVTDISLGGNIMIRPKDNHVVLIDPIGV